MSYHLTLWNEPADFYFNTKKEERLLVPDKSLIRIPLLGLNLGVDLANTAASE